MPLGLILLWVAIIAFVGATLGVSAGRINLLALGLLALAVRMLL